MTTRRFFLVRHGETDWNVVGRLQGRRDVPLNTLGRIQAGQVGRVLAQLAGDTRALSYVSSPLSRAVETMRILRTGLDLPRKLRTRRITHFHVAGRGDVRTREDRVQRRFQARRREYEHHNSSYQSFHNT